MTGRERASTPLWWAPWLALALGLVVTALLAYSLHRSDYIHDHARFSNDVRQTEDDLERRIETYVNLLRASRELFYFNENITKAEFSRFINGLKIRQRYPGIQGVGFTVKVGAALSKTNSALLVVPPRPVWPQGQREELHAITALEPLDSRNDRALGFDMFSNPVRSRAMKKARDTGEPVTSGRVTLVQETGQAQQPGFLIYVPVYLSGFPKTNESERRAALLGFIYSPFRANDFFTGIFSPKDDRSLEFRVYDREAGRDYLLWDSNPANTSERPRFQIEKKIQVPGSQWHISFRSRSAPSVLPFFGLVPMSIVLGACSSFLLFFLLRDQIRARAQAEFSADELRTQQKVTLGLAQVQSLTEALAAVLDVLSENQPWDAGLLWVIDEETNALRCKETWSKNPLVANFLADSRKRTFQKGQGAPGRVWETASSFYIPEVQKSEFRRKEEAAAANLISCLSFPILLKSKVYGVVEVLSSQPGPKQAPPALYFMAETIGTQMGQVAERLRVQQQLRESEQLHRTVTNATADGLVTIDESSKIITVNPAACRIFGYTQQELIGKSLSDLMPERHRERHNHGMKRFVSTRTAHIPWNALEMPGLHKSGREIPLEISFGVTEIGNKLLFTGGIRDITERKKVEESRRYTIRQSSLRAEISTAFATQQSSIRGSLQAACESIVQNLDVTLARAWTIQPGADFLEMQASAGLYTHTSGGHAKIQLGKLKIGKIGKEERPYFSDDLLNDPDVPDKDWVERERLTAFAGYPLKLENRLIGVVGLFARRTFTDEERSDLQTLMDLIAQGVERKRAEGMIKQLNEELERKVEARTHDMVEIYNQMEAFTYSVSHDLRAPVRAITSFAQAFLEEHSAGIAPEGKLYIEKIAAAGQRMDIMLQSLLEYSRITRAEFKPEPVPVSAVIHSAIQDLETEIKAKNATVEVLEPLPLVLANKQMLTQCFFNLISNSLKYVATGVQPRVLIRAELAGHRAKIWVEDNGVGISNEYHQKIFGMFERLHTGPMYPGTGIGLTIVKKAIERMDGKVGLQSAGNNGTKFWVELPLA